MGEMDLLKVKGGKWEPLLSSPEVRSWRVLLSAFRVIFQYLESGLQKEGCSVIRFQVLFWLYFYGPLYPIDLAKGCYVSRGNISSLLKRMQQESLIMPVASCGKRPKVDLTHDGKSYFEKLLFPHLKRVKAIMPPLSKVSLKRLEKICNRAL